MGNKLKWVVISSCGSELQLDDYHVIQLEKYNSPEKTPVFYKWGVYCEDLSSDGKRWISRSLTLVGGSIPKKFENQLKNVIIKMANRINDSEECFELFGKCARQSICTNDEGFLDNFLEGGYIEK